MHLDRLMAWTFRPADDPDEAPSSAIVRKLALTSRDWPPIGSSPELAPRSTHTKAVHDELIIIGQSGPIEISTP